MTDRLFKPEWFCGSDISTTESEGYRTELLRCSCGVLHFLRQEKIDRAAVTPEERVRSLGQIVCYHDRGLGTNGRYCAECQVRMVRDAEGAAFLRGVRAGLERAGKIADIHGWEQSPCPCPKDMESCGDVIARACRAIDPATVEDK